MMMWTRISPAHQCQSTGMIDAQAKILNTGATMMALTAILVGGPPVLPSSEAM